LVDDLAERVEFWIIAFDHLYRGLETGNIDLRARRSVAAQSFEIPLGALFSER
jgi:hypothetical protein